MSTEPDLAPSGRKTVVSVLAAGVALAAAIMICFAPLPDRAPRAPSPIDGATRFLEALGEQSERRAAAGEKAVEAIEAALRGDEKNAPLWIWLGRCRRVLGRDPSEAFERAVAADASSAEARLERGRSKLERYRRSRGEPEGTPGSFRELRPERPEERALRESGMADVEAARERGIAGHMASYAEALGAFGRGDYAKAEEVVGSYLLRALWDAEAWLFRARARRFQRKPVDEDVAWALDLEPGHPAAPLLVASARRDEGRSKEALGPAMKAASGDPAVRCLRGALHLDLQDWRAAETEFTEAIRLDPAISRAWSGRAWARISLGRYGEGESDGTKAIELDPGDGAAWNRRGVARVRLDRLPEALEDLRKGVALDAVDAAGANELGSLLLALGRGAEAEEAFTETIRRDERILEAWVHRAILRLELGRIEESEADFARAIALDPKHARAWSERSRGRSRRGGFAKAAEDADRAAELRPDDPPVARAYARAHAGRAAEAIEDFRRIAGAHDYAWLWIWLLRTRRGEGEAATLELQTTLRIRPKADWFSTIAQYLVGSATEESFLKAAGAADPKQAREQECEAYFYAGMKRLFAGDTAGAVDYFRESVESGVPDLVEHAGSRAELQRMGLK